MAGIYRHYHIRNIPQMIKSLPFRRSAKATLLLVHQPQRMVAVQAPCACITLPVRLCDSCVVSGFGSRGEADSQIQEPLNHPRRILQRVDRLPLLEDSGRRCTRHRVARGHLRRHWGIQLGLCRGESTRRTSMGGFSATFRSIFDLWVRMALIRGSAFIS